MSESDARSPACCGSEPPPATGLEDLPADVLSLVLRRLDGASLASLGCASSGLRDRAADPAAWRGLCLDEWPALRSLPRGCLRYRALFADAFPFPSPLPPLPPASFPLPARLLSAVDLRHAGAPVLSRALDTDAASAWFLTTPFRVDALPHEGISVPPSSATTPTIISAAALELTWVLIDPATGRALDASARRPVAVHRGWLAGDAVARFTLVLPGAGTTGLALAAAVTCDERLGHVRDLCLRVEDADGRAVSGRDGLAAVAAAMAAPGRARRGAAEADVARRYREFVAGRRARREWKDRREGIIDLCCSGIGAAAVIAFLAMLAFR